MYVRDKIKENLVSFSEICERHGIKSLYAFGSSVTDRFDPRRSDIDLLVEMKEMDPLERGEQLLSLWDKLEAFFQRKVDLLTAKSLRNPYLSQSINDTKVLLYDYQGEKVFV